MTSAARACLLLALCAATAPAPAWAFKRSHVTNADGSTGPDLFWCTRTLPFIVNSAGSKDAGAAASTQAARESFAPWSSTDCSDFEFEDQGVTTRTDVGFDTSGSVQNLNLVVWRERTCAKAAPAGDACLSSGGCNNLYNCWEQASQIIAVTTTTFNKKTGELYDADIELNGAYFVFTTGDGPACANPPPRPATTCVATDVKNTLVHEIGHVIGLDHTTDPKTTMYPSAALGDVDKRTLQADDIAGLCTIYPKGKGTAGCEEPPLKGDGCGCGSGAGPVLPLAAALLALAARRRRS